MDTKKYFLLTFAVCVSFMTAAQNQSKRQYFRHLKYNHVSPYVKLAGIYPISEAEASTTSHYVFNYNKKNQLVLITNNHYFTERRHPLASIGAYKTIFTYQDHKETRIFLDKNGNRVSNDRGVFKKFLHLTKKGTIRN